MGTSRGPMAPGPLLVQQGHFDLLKLKQPVQERVTPDNPSALIPYCISKQLSYGGHFLTRAGTTHSLSLDLLWQYNVIQKSPLRGA